MGTLQRAVLDAVAGVVVGAAATVPMSALMLAAQRKGLVGALPPRRVTDAALDTADEAATGGRVDPPDGARTALTALFHLGFGAAAGVPLALLRRALPTPLPDPAVGAAYGLGVWASAYLGWVPALGIMPRADEDRADRTATMVLGHLVYGAVLGAGLRLFRPRT